MFLTLFFQQMLNQKFFTESKHHPQDYPKDYLPWIFAELFGSTGENPRRNWMCQIIKLDIDIIALKTNSFSNAKNVTTDLLSAMKPIAVSHDAIG